MHSLHHVLMKTYLQMKRLVSAQAMPLGLSPGQPKILEFLAEYGEHEQKDIAEYCDIEPATVGNILLRMEASGLINRRNRPNNLWQYAHCLHLFIYCFHDILIGSHTRYNVSKRQFLLPLRLAILFGTINTISHLSSVHPQDNNSD